MAQGLVALGRMLTLSLFEMGTSMGEAVTVYISPQSGPLFLGLPFLDILEILSNKFPCKRCANGKLFLACNFISEVLFSLMRVLMMVNEEKKTL